MRAVFSPPSQVAREDEPAALEEYASALSRFDYRDLERGWARMRESYKRPFWPPIALLVEAVQAAQSDRLSAMPKKEKLRGRMVDGVVQPWGGACQCRACRLKIPRGEFFHASAEQYAAAEAIREELDYDLQRRIGFDPRIGPAGADDTTDRQRSPAELTKMLETTRKRYYRVFNPGAPAPVTHDRPPMEYRPSAPELIAEMLSKLAEKVEQKREEEFTL
jgi:hypothetical protein